MKTALPLSAQMLFANAQKKQGFNSITAAMGANSEPSDLN